MTEQGVDPSSDVRQGSTVAAQQESKDEAPSPAALSLPRWASAFAQGVSGPAMWDRMAGPPQGDQAVATAPGQQRHNFASGANVTLQDIARDPTVRIPEEGEFVIVNDHYIGTPDPDKYLRGTNFLSDSELKQELADGNLMPIKEYEQARDEALKTLSPEEIYSLQRKVEFNHLKNEVFVDVGNGTQVSAWDLYQYVHHNPELKALAALKRHIPTTTDASPSSQMDSTQTGPTENDLSWSLVGTDMVWQRRPTRWFKNLDGVPNFTIAAYVHEGSAAAVLGPAYAYSDQEAGQVLRSEQYLRDVAKAGPLMGMTFLITAARDLPLEDVAESVHGHLLPRLTRPGASPEEQSQAMDTLAKFYSNFQPERLAASTVLLDRTQRKLLEGSTLVITTGDEGRMLFQAYSPGMVREKESYLLGAMKDESVCTALTELFIGHDKKCLTPDLRRQAAAGVMVLAHGRQLHEDPLPAYNPPVLFGKQPRFRLPFVGKPNKSTLLSGVLDTLVSNRCEAAVMDAVEAGSAAAAVELGGASSSSSDAGVFGGSSPSFQAVMEAQRQAAKEAFSRGVSCLGIDVDDLELSSFPGLESIFGQIGNHASLSEGADGQVAAAGKSEAKPAAHQTV